MNRHFINTQITLFEIDKKHIVFSEVPEYCGYILPLIRGYKIDKCFYNVAMTYSNRYSIFENKAFNFFVVYSKDFYSVT